MPSKKVKVSKVKVFVRWASREEGKPWPPLPVPTFFVRAQGTCQTNHNALFVVNSTDKTNTLKHNDGRHWIGSLGKFSWLCILGGGCSLLLREHTIKIKLYNATLAWLWTISCLTRITSEVGSTIYIISGSSSCFSLSSQYFWWFGSGIQSGWGQYVNSGCFSPNDPTCNSRTNSQYVPATTVRNPPTKRIDWAFHRK